MTPSNQTEISENFTVVDLFCGAGGMALGFKQLGFKVVCAIDNDQAALTTYRENLGDHAIESDLSTRPDLPPATVIIGGPPCQGFSSAGLRKENDHRNTLISCYADIISRLRPSAFVFENVEGFLTAEGGRRVFELLDPLVGAGYRIHLRKINAANYGIPQHRKRVIAIGGLGWTPSFPAPTHSAFGAPGAHLVSQTLKRTPTVYEALVTLPLASSEAPGNPDGHFYKPLVGIDLQRAHALAPGQSMRDLPGDLQHESFRRRAYRRVMDGTPTERRGGPPFGVRRLRGDEPSKAITGGSCKEFIHPTEDRPLTIRECARLQTFPDTFKFHGNSAEQSQLIGNAVPPLLAQIIAFSLKQDLQRKPLALDPGALLSFLPTASSGYSPVLRQLTTTIKKNYLKVSEQATLHGFNEDTTFDYHQS